MSGNVSSRIPVCCFLSLMSPLFLISSCQERAEWHAAPRTEIKRWNACLGFPSLAFPYSESDYLQPSFGLMASITPVSLLTCKVWSFDLYLKKLPCNMVYILTQSSIKHPCSTRVLGPRVLSLSLSFSLSLSGWFSGAWKPAELIFLPRLSRPLQEGALCLHEWYKPCPRALLVFCVTQGILASFLLSLSYHWLWATRFRSIKGLQHRKNNHNFETTMYMSIYIFFVFSSTHKCVFFTKIKLLHFFYLYYIFLFLNNKLSRHLFPYIKGRRNLEKMTFTFSSIWGWHDFF